MSWHIFEAYRLRRDSLVVLIGTFSTIVVPECTTHVTRPEPIRSPPFDPVAARAWAQETIRTHTFGVGTVRHNAGPPCPVLFVRLGEPVEWLPEWRWSDPMWRAVWRGEAPDPLKPHIVDLATGKRAS